jgi:hypothetical protein
VRGKPIAVTEFGCGTFRGAGEVGDTADAMIAWGDDDLPHRDDPYLDLDRARFAR